MSGADTPNYGHVQVKFNGTWGTICTMRDLPYPSAEVICRQLGLGPALKQTFMNDECTAVREGAETVWLSSLNCQGFEHSVDQCPHRGWGKLDPEYCLGCTPKHCSACLICQPVTTNTTGKVEQSLILLALLLFFHSPLPKRIWVSDRRSLHWMCQPTPFALSVIDRTLN